MHTAPRTFKVHDVKLLVEECIEDIGACFHARHRTFKHFLIHIFDSICVSRYLKELAQLLMCFLFRIKIHLGRLLQFLVCLVFDLSPRLFFLRFLLMLFLEESRSSRVDTFLFLFLVDLELALGLKPFPSLFLKYIEVAVVRVHSLRLEFNFVLMLFVPHKLSLGEFWSHLLLTFSHLKPLLECRTTCLLLLCRYLSWGAFPILIERDALEVGPCTLPTLGCLICH